MTLFHALLGAGSATPGVLSRISVKFTTTDFAYLTAKTGITVNDATDSKPIGYVQFGAVNPGVAYDPQLDEIIVGYGNGVRHFTREGYATAAAAALGTEPTFTKTISSGMSTHGRGFDPVNRRYFSLSGSTSFTLFDYDGNSLGSHTPSGITQFSSGAYDWVNGIFYTTTSGGGNPVQAVQLVNGTWTKVYDSDFNSNDGPGVDFWLGADHLVYHNGRAYANKTDGLDIAVYPLPLTGLAYEGIMPDPIDGTLWSISPNVLSHYDPRGLYRKYFSNRMYNWSNWKLNGNTVTGQWHEEVLNGTNFSVGPVVDYGANTGQQSAGNWTIPSGEQATLEFRGSGSAPTTSPEAVRDFLQLPLYDPNGTNDGWGSTVPGAWQSTPTTDRYMQVRVKPLVDSPVVTSSPITILGNDLLAWFTSMGGADGLANQYHASYVDWSAAATPDVTRLKDAFDPAIIKDFLPAAIPPQYINGQFDIGATNSGARYFIADDEAFWKSLTGAFEVTIVGRRAVTGNRALYLCLNQNSSNNNQLVLEHSASSDSPASFLSVRYVTGAGTVNLMGVTDTSVATRMLSFLVGDGVENKIWVNKVLQSLTVSSGANSGQGLSAIASSVNSVTTGRKIASTSVQGRHALYDIIISNPLTDQKRSDLYDWCDTVRNSI